MESKEEKARLALARVYAANYEKIVARIASVRGALDALATDTGADGVRHAAEMEAHKLAGVLGTFGMAEGTRLAREIEVSIKHTEALSPDAVERLKGLCQALQAEVKPPA